MNTAANNRVEPVHNGRSPMGRNQNLSMNTDANTVELIYNGHLWGKNQWL